MVSPSGPLTLDTSSVMITYTDEDGASKYQTQPITVLPKEVKAARKLAVKALNLLVGDDASADFLQLLASWNDQISKAVTVEETDALLEKGEKVIKTQQEKERQEKEQQEKERQVKKRQESAVKTLSLLAGDNASADVLQILVSCTDQINEAVTVEEIDALLEEGEKNIKTQQEKEKKDPVADIRLNIAKKTLYARQDTKNGDTLQLTATVTKSDPDIEPPAVQWKSSNTKIAAVDQNGLVKIRDKAGKVTITATCGNKSASCVITVRRVNQNVRKLSGVKKKIAMKKGKTRKLTVKFQPETSYWNELKWTTSDKKIVRVDATDRTLKAVGKGTCEVTISSVRKPDVKLTIQVVVR